MPKVSSTWTTHPTINVHVASLVLPVETNLFMLPPLPAILLFHTSSDQYCEYSNLFWRSSFSLQNSIAPSYSRGSSPCRRKVFPLFAIEEAWSNWAHGSISIHVLSRIGIVLEDEQAVEGLLGFALTLDQLANAILPSSLQVSCSLLSSSLLFL